MKSDYLLLFFSFGLRTVESETIEASRMATISLVRTQKEVEDVPVFPEVVAVQGLLKE